MGSPKVKAQRSHQRTIKQRSHDSMGVPLVQKVAEPKISGKIPNSLRNQLGGDLEMTQTSPDLTGIVFL